MFSPCLGLYPTNKSAVDLVKTAVDENKAKAIPIIYPTHVKLLIFFILDYTSFK